VVRLETLDHNGDGHPERLGELAETHAAGTRGPPHPAAHGLLAHPTCLGDLVLGDPGPLLL
jgi:hypothetical protein